MNCAAGVSVFIDGAKHLDDVDDRWADPLPGWRLGIRHRLTAAIRSLEAVSTPGRPLSPLYIEVGSDGLCARFAGPDRRPPATSPWYAVDGGRAWRLDAVAPVVSLAPPERAGGYSTLVSVDDGLLVNLMALGTVEVVGPPAAVDHAVTAMVQELHFSPTSGPVEIMAVGSQLPAMAADLMGHFDRARLHSAPPTVVVLGTDDVKEITATLGEASAAGAPVIMAGGHPSGRSAWSITVGSGPATIEPARRLLSLVGLGSGPERESRPSGLEPASGPMVRVLGPMTVSGHEWDLSPQQQALMSFLACFGPVGRPAIVDGLWGGRRTSDSRFANLLAELRATIGRDRLPVARDGRYRLDGVETDLERLEHLAREAETEPSPEADRRLLMGLGLITGVPFSAPSGRYWSWVGERPDQASMAEALVVGSAVRLAERLRAGGNDDEAERAYRSALTACPFDEDLVMALAKAYLERGTVARAHRLVQGWEARIDRLGFRPGDRPRRLLTSFRSTGAGPPSAG